MPEALKHLMPLPVGQLRVDAMEQVEVGIERRIGQEIMGADVGLWEDSAQSRDGGGGILGQHEPSLRPDPLKPAFERGAPDPVGRQATDAPALEEPIDRTGALTDVRPFVGYSLPLRSSARQRKGTVRARPESIPGLRAHELVADQITVGPEVEVVGKRDPHAAAGA
jgi:hypothetical protein